MILRFIAFATALLVFACQNQDDKSFIKNSLLDTKTDSAILLMYKLYSECETSVLQNNHGKIDTIIKKVSYLCLPVKVNIPEVHGDTTLITIFFEPENGYETEDPKCNFAYSVGFTGQDTQYDFVVFGDNYYTLNASQIKQSKPNMEFIFNDKIAKTDCIDNKLRQLLNRQK